MDNEDSTDIMTSSVEIQCELPLEKIKPKLDASTPDLLKLEQTRCQDIVRLVNQAEELVQKQAQQQMKKNKNRSFNPLSFEEEGKNASRNKMCRIKEWLNQSSEGNKSDNNQVSFLLCGLIRIIKGLLGHVVLWHVLNGRAKQ